jgi:hypothetical protein
MIVDRDKASATVLSRLAYLVGFYAAANSGEVFRQHQVEAGRFDQLLGLGQFLSVEILARASAGDDPKADGTVVVVPHEPTQEGLLVFEASLILVIRADATNP